MAQFTVGDHLRRLSVTLTRLNIGFLTVEENNGQYSVTYKAGASQSEQTLGNETANNFDDSDGAHEAWLIAEEQRALAIAELRENPLAWAAAVALSDWYFNWRRWIVAITDAIFAEHGTVIDTSSLPEASWEQTKARVDFYIEKIMNGEPLG